MPQRKQLPALPEQTGNGAKSSPRGCTWPRNPATPHLLGLPCVPTVWLPTIFLIHGDTHHIYFLWKFFSFFRVRTCAVVNSKHLPSLNQYIQNLKDRIQFLFSRGEGLLISLALNSLTSAMCLTARPLHTTDSHQCVVLASIMNGDEHFYPWGYLMLWWFYFQEMILFNTENWEG